MSATNKHGLLLLFFTPGSKDPGVKTKKAKIKMWHGPAGQLAECRAKLLLS